ncbi:hypothetical protein J6590_036823 [Homalodisca vitripennis]|nr:hypothetical protein J6590_036823 [Homalodisca vitripennis]
MTSDVRSQISDAARKKKDSIVQSLTRSVSNRGFNRKFRHLVSQSATTDQLGQEGDWVRWGVVVSFVGVSIDYKLYY